MRPENDEALQRLYVLCALYKRADALRQWSSALDAEAQRNVYIHFEFCCRSGQHCLKLISTHTHTHPNIILEPGGLMVFHGRTNTQNGARTVHFVSIRRSIVWRLCTRGRARCQLWYGAGTRANVTT